MRLSKAQTIALFFGVFLALQVISGYFFAKMMAAQTGESISSFFYQIFSSFNTLFQSPTVGWIGVAIGILLNTALVLVIIWGILTCAQKANLHLLVWNAPQEKTFLNSCFIPGIGLGVIAGLLAYGIAIVGLIPLWPNVQTLASTMPDGFSTSFNTWIYLIRYAGIFSTEALRLFLLALGIIIINYIKPLRQSVTANISNIIVSILFLSPSLFLVFNHAAVPTDSSALLTFSSASLDNFVGIIFGWAMITYSFECALVAHLVCTGIIMGFSFL